jgi:hypothetical protein
MREIRATVEPEHTAALVELARKAGIEKASVTDVYVHGPDVKRQIVSFETSTPKARALVDLLLNAEALKGSSYSLTSREVRAIVNDEGVPELTRPLSVPFSDVIQDLWQLSHVTPTYLARAGAGAVLLATGVLNNDPIGIVLAALFLPFLSEVLAVTFGLWSQDMRLVRHGATALGASIVLAVAGGAAVGLIQGGPVMFSGFKGPGASFAISAAIGITAGLSTADDTGRRYLIGVAAAVQLAIIPVWLGVALAVGMPSTPIVISRLESFAINLVTIAGAALVAFAGLHLRGRGIWAPPRSHRM